MAEATSNLQFANNTQNSISDSDMGDAIRMDDQENAEENAEENGGRDDENGVVV